MFKWRVRGILVLTVSFFLLAGGGHPAGAMDLYIMAGQSNMVGIDDVDILPTFPNADRIQIFSNAWEWAPGAEPVDSPVGQKLPVSADPEAGASPGMAFADRMVEWTGRDVGLIPCQKGATSIEQWQPSYSYESLYGACLAAVRRASLAGTVRGIIFWQGESDAMESREPEQWPARFATMVRAFRQDLRMPDLPVVFAQLGPDPSAHTNAFPYWDEVKAQQALTKDDRLAMIQTDDLPVLDDGVHVTAAGIVEAGRRFAAAMYDLIE